MSSASQAGDEQLLVMGPWVHGGWAGGRGDGDSLGHVPFNVKTAAVLPRADRIPVLRISTSRARANCEHPAAWMFETGTNQWRKHDAWPPKTARPKSLLFSGGRPARSSRRRAIAGEPTTNTSATRPNRCRTWSASPSAWLADYMVGRPALRRPRPDVLVYQTEPLHRGCYRGRPAPGGAARFDDRDRFRLGGQADRRLSRRLSPDRNRNPAESAWAAISNWFAAT